MLEDPRERRGDRARPGWAWAGLPKSAGLAQTQGWFAPPFPCTRRIFNPMFVEAPPFTIERAIRTERPSTS
jgi:hypothetical protein